MLNRQIASILSSIAQLTSLEGATAKFRSLAFTKAAKMISGMSTPIEKADLTSMKGIGPSLQQVIGELIKSKGKTCKRWEELKRDHPASVLELTQVSGIGAIRAYKLHEQYQVKNLNHLFRLLTTGRIKDEKLLASVKEAISRRDSGMDRLPIGWVYPVIEGICVELKKVKGVLSARAAGSVRRFKDTVGDCDILVTVKNKGAKRRVMKKFMALASSESEKMVMGPQKARIRVPVRSYPFQVDLLVVPRDEFGSALLYFSGSKDFNVGLRKVAIRKGMKLSEHGLFKGKKVVAAKSEKEIFHALGLKWIPPELREGEDDVHLDPVPRLYKGDFVDDVGEERIAQDLHTHTIWSDGVSTPDEMVERAIAGGLKTIAITDHSYSIRKKFDQYVAAIEAVKEKYKRDIRVLVGSEVDIKKDGSLGLEPGQLRQLDFVVGSIHHNHKENVEERLIAAAKSGHIDIIGHPTGRYAGSREIPEIDWDRVFGVCAKHKVALEINPNVDRLDLPADLVKMAKARGCKFAINTDAHSASHLGFVFLGLKIAKRAGLTKSDMFSIRG